MPTHTHTVSKHSHTGVRSRVDELSIEATQRSLESGRLPSVRFADAHGLTLLHLACASAPLSSHSAASLTVIATASLANTESKANVHTSARDGNSSAATISGEERTLQSSERVRFVEWLCTQGASLCATDAQGWTPLHACAQRGDAAVLSVLLNAGADPTLRSRNGELPIHFAVQHSYPGLSVADLEALFLKLGLREHLNDMTDNGEALLHLACAGKGDQRVLQLILEQRHLFIDAVSQVTGSTALQHAITCGLPCMVLMLLDAGASAPEIVATDVNKTQMPKSLTLATKSRLIEKATENGENSTALDQSRGDADPDPDENTDRAVIYRLLQQSSAEDLTSVKSSGSNDDVSQSSSVNSNLARDETGLSLNTAAADARRAAAGSQDMESSSIAFSFRQPRVNAGKPRREGTWHQLIDFVLSDEGACSGENLLVCYPVLEQDPGLLLAELLERHADACSDGARQSAAMRRRVLRLLRRWMRHSREWRHTPSLLNQLVEYTNSIVSSSSRQRLQALIDQFRERTAEASARQASSLLVKPTKTATEALANYTLQRDSTKHLGDRLTVYEYQLFTKIDFAQTLQRDVSNFPSSFVAYERWFDSVSAWLQMQILQGKDPKARTVLLMKSIRLGVHLRKLNNFNGVLQVLCALFSDPVFRLSQSWSSVTQSVLADLEELCELMASTHDYRAYREALELVPTSEPCIPNLACLMGDLAFVIATNPVYVRANTVINFDVIDEAGPLIRAVERRQRQHYELSVGTSSLSKVGTDLFHTLTPDQLLARSCKLESADDTCHVPFTVAEYQPIFRHLSLSGHAPVLTRADHLSLIDREELKQIGTSMVVEHNHIILDPRLLNFSIFEVVRGGVRVVKRYAGRLVVNMLGPGSLLGSISAYNHGEVTALAIAQTDEVELIEYPVQKLEELFTRLPYLSARFFKTIDFYLATHLCNQNQQLIDVQETPQPVALPIPTSLLPESSREHREEKRPRRSLRIISHLPLGSSRTEGTPPSPRAGGGAGSKNGNVDGGDGSGGDLGSASTAASSPIGLDSSGNMQSSTTEPLNPKDRDNVSISSSLSGDATTTSPNRKHSPNGSSSSFGLETTVGGSPQSNRRNRNTDLPSLFDLPVSEVQIAQFPVTVRRKRMNLVGMMHLTNKHVCIYAKFFSYVHRVLLSTDSITNMDVRGATLHIVSFERVIQITLRKEEQVHEAYAVLQQLVGSQMMQILDASAVSSSNADNPSISRRMSVAARHSTRAESMSRSPKASSPRSHRVDVSYLDVPVISKDTALSSEDWDLLLRGASTMVFFKDDLILLEGSSRQRLFYISEGECRVEKSSNIREDQQVAQAIVQYADKITLAVLPEGSSFGELALCLATKGSASVIAHSPLVKTLVIEGYYLNLLFQKKPHLEERFFRYLYALIAYRLRVFKTDTATEKSPTSTEPESPRDHASSLSRSRSTPTASRQRFSSGSSDASEGKSRAGSLETVPTLDSSAGCPVDPPVTASAAASALTAENLALLPQRLLNLPRRGSLVPSSEISDSWGQDYPSVAELSSRSRSHSLADLAPSEPLDARMQFYEENGVRVIQSGSVRALLAELIPPPGVAQNEEFVTTFLLTHSYFISSSALLRKLVKRFRLYRSQSRQSSAVTQGPESIEDEICLAQGGADRYDRPLVLQARLLNVIKTWLQIGYEWDFHASPLLKELVSFLKRIVTDSHSDLLASGLASNLLRQLSEKTEALQKTESIHTMEGNPSGFLEHIESNQLFAWSEINARSAAEALTHIEFGLFSKIPHTEFITQAFKDPLRSPKLRVCIDRFNLVTRWIVSTVLSCELPIERAEQISKFIDIAVQLRKISNYSGMMQVLSSLNNSCVSRLHQSWKLVDVDRLEHFNEMNSLMDSKGNHHLYREALAVSRYPILPFHAICIKDLTFIEEANEDFLDEQRKIVNFEKMRLLGKVLLSIRRAQSMPYVFRVAVSTEQEMWFKNLSTLPGDEDDLYELSLQREAISRTNKVTKDPRRRRSKSRSSTGDKSVRHKSSKSSKYAELEDVLYGLQQQLSTHTSRITSLKEENAILRQLLETAGVQDVDELIVAKRNVLEGKNE